MLTGSQVLPTDMLGDVTSSSKWVGEPDYVDGRCPEVSGVLVPSRCSLDFTPVTSTVASPNPPATISEASSAIEKSYMSPLPKCPIPHLQIFTSKTSVACHRITPNLYSQCTITKSYIPQQ